MGIDFPHLKGDIPGFPGAGRDLYEQIPGKFDQSEWTEGTKIVLMSVPWGLYEPNISNFVPGFDSVEERNEWFKERINGTGSPTESHTLETPVRVEFENYVELPFTFDYTARYNYLYVQYGTAPVANGSEGIKEWFFHIVDCDYSSPSCTRVKITPDYWTTFAPVVEISSMMLERGHYPVANTSVESYLNNPIANNQMLLASDVDYGDHARLNVSKFTDHFFNEEAIPVLVLAGISIFSYKGTLTNKPGTIPNVNKETNGYDVTPNAYAFVDGDFSTFLAQIAETNPVFYKYIIGIYFVNKEFIRIDENSTCTTPNGTFKQVIGGVNVEINDTLSKTDFGFDERIADLAKLYTYPYSHIELASSDGSITEVRIENLSGNGTRLAVAFNNIFPSITFDTRLSNYGGAPRTVYFGDVSAQLGGMWQSVSHEFGVPIYGLQVPADSVAESDSYYGRENAKKNAEIDKQIASLRNQTSYDNTKDSLKTAQDNANRSADTASDNAQASADLAYHSAISSANTLYNNTINSLGASKTNTEESAATLLANSKRNADTSRTNSYKSADTALANANSAADAAADNSKDSLRTNAEIANASAQNAYNTGYIASKSTYDQGTASAATAKGNVNRTIDASDSVYQAFKINQMQDANNQNAWQLYSVDREEDKATGLFLENKEMTERLNHNQIVSDGVNTANSVIASFARGGDNALVDSLSSIASTVSSGIKLNADTDVILTNNKETIRVSAGQDRFRAEDQFKFQMNGNAVTGGGISGTEWRTYNLNYVPTVTVASALYNANRLANLNAAVDNANDTLDTIIDNAALANRNNEKILAANLQTSKDNTEKNRVTTLENTNRTQTTTKANALNSKNASYTIADNSHNASHKNAQAVHDTTVANNTRSYDTGMENAELSNQNSTIIAKNTKGTATANQDRTRGCAIENARQSKDTGDTNNYRSYYNNNEIIGLMYNKSINAIEAGLKDKKLGSPISAGSTSGAETAKTRPIGITVNVVTEDKSAIFQAGCQFKRYGYNLNQTVNFTTWNVMEHFSYWKATDVWLTGIDDAPEEAQDTIRYMLYNGVTAWRNPDDIGKVNIYDN